AGREVNHERAKRNSGSPAPATRKKVQFNRWTFFYYKVYETEAGREVNPERAKRNSGASDGASKQICPPFKLHLLLKNERRKTP
ncbi:MAG: hypothetical protein KDC83_11455, partial [Flavobacteriales bacterium]|nr:hypothetical protein [Flavobacteriales bacterium]